MTINLTPGQSYKFKSSKDWLAIIKQRNHEDFAIDCFPESEMDFVAIDSTPKEFLVRANDGNTFRFCRYLQCSQGENVVRLVIEADAFGGTLGEIIPLDAAN